MNRPSADTRQIEPVNRSRKRTALCLLGLVAIALAWGVRASVLARRHAPDDAASRQRGLLRQAAAQIETLRKELAANPSDLQAHKALAACYQRYGMSDLFLAELETIVRLDPKDQNVQLALAGAYGILKRWPQATARYLAIVRTWPDSAAGWQQLSVTFYSMKQYRNAMWAAQKALRLRPDDPNNRFGMAASTLEWAIQSDRTGNHIPQIDSAQQELNRLLPTWPDKAGIHFLLGRAYAELDRVDLAVQHLAEANRLHPEAPEIAYGLGRLYFKQQRLAEGRDVVQRALAANPQDANLIDLLGQLWQSGAEPGAAANALIQYQKAVGLAPNNPLFQERLGSAYLRAGNVEQARLAFEAAIKIDPNLSFPYQQLAVVYVRLGDKAHAARAAEAAREMAFNEEQLKHLQSLVTTHPENVSLHVQLADRYRYLGLNGMAQDEYLAAKQIDPKNAHVAAGLKTLRTGAAPGAGQ